MSLDTYKRSLHRCPRFSAEEERRLCGRARRGDAEARERLILSQLPWALELARKYASRRAALEDMIQCASTGVIRAVDSLDPRKGRLSTHAVWHVKRECLLWCRQHTAPVVQLPSNVTARNKPAVDAAKAREVEPFCEERHHWPVEHRDFFASDGVTGEDLLAAIAALPAVQRQVIERRLAGESLREIGADLAVTRQRVSQIELRAIQEMRALLGAGPSCGGRRTRAA